MRMTKEMFSREHQLSKRKHFPEHVRVLISKLRVGTNNDSINPGTDIDQCDH